MKPTDLNRHATVSVAILLCTYNGGRYLGEQLDSLATQTLPGWHLWVSDDGSTDGTLGILAARAQQWPADRMTTLRGPARGATANFLTLACNPDIDADYYAYCDQDDIWEPEKLARAVVWLDTVSSDIPALYCSRTRSVDENNCELGFSPLNERPPSFANALVQNVAGGNTMVFNRAARALLREAGANLVVAFHDWWTYLVVAGCGGRVHYDPWPSLRYRQHDDNVIGLGDMTWRGYETRIRTLWGGRFQRWVGANIKALDAVRPSLTSTNQAALTNFAAARDLPLLSRLRALRRSGVYRQTLLGNLGLSAAAILGKI